VIVRAEPWVRRLAVFVTACGLALASGCIFGPKQDDPSSGDQSGADSGVFSMDASSDTNAGGCVDDGTHGHEAGPGYDACPGAPADGAVDAKADAPSDSGATDTIGSDAPTDAPSDADAGGEGGDAVDETIADDAPTGD
jgi:hypothetical protein